MKHTEKHKHSGHQTKSSSISSKGRKKAMILLIVIAVVIMLTYALSFQDAQDDELIKETTPQTAEP
ncbi:MAG: hypothetical protein AAF462_00930 [Thermodesulfobacteriota bacterium]